MQIPSRRNLERAIIIALTLILILPLVQKPLRIEYGLIDFRFAVNRGGTGSADYDQVVIVLADTESEARLGRLLDSSWREFYPEFIDVLEDAGARAVIWDVAFAASEPEFDSALARRFEAGIPIVAGEDPSSVTVEALRGSFAHIGWLGFAAVDSIPRRAPADVDPPPISWIAASYLDGGTVDLNNPPDHDTWIDYSRDLDEIPSFSLADVLESDGQRLANDLRTPLSVFRDRVVFVGQALPSSDRYQMPGSGGVRIPGVYSQVIAALTFNQPRQITRPAPAVDWLIAAIIAIALTIVWTLSRRLGRRIATVAVVIIGLLAPLVFFAAWRIWISYSAMLVALIVPLLAVGIARRMSLTKSYRHSLGFDPELIQQHQELIESYATGVERQAVVLCSDVRNYTQFVTDHDANMVQRVMTEYMAAMENVVDSFGGYVNKYVGDEIVAVFGFPRNEKDAVNRAVDAGLAMLHKLAALREKWENEELPPLEAVGIGLDAGSLRFTHIGGRHRVQFDIIGNAINGASRLQTLTKEHGRSLILPAEMVELQDRLEVVMFGTPESEVPPNSVSFLGEVLVRGQGRRRVYGLA
jgi:class 3 adenylate cyclase/CHASE2 domain-containing sensor protein